jgi:hypothetical protein
MTVRVATLSRRRDRTIATAMDPRPYAANRKATSSFVPPSCERTITPVFTITIQPPADAAKGSARSPRRHGVTR